MFPTKHTPANYLSQSRMRTSPTQLKNSRNLSSHFVFNVLCQSSEFDVEFNAIISDEQFYGVKHQQETITGIFYHSSSFRYLKKELLVHDTPSLVGSLGGFLGLFVGFSFFGAFTFLMNKMCKD